MYNDSSKIPPLELPSISKKASAESSAPSDDSVHSSDDDILSYSSETTSQGGSSSRTHKSVRDSAKDSLDEGVDSEIQRIQAGSTSNDFEVSVMLTKNTSQSSSDEERVTSSEAGSRVVEKMTIVELEDDESVVEVMDERKDSSEEKVEMSDNDDALLEMEERLKAEKERTIELKAKFNKYMESESRQPVNPVTIDLERKEKLLAALQAIDRGSPVKTTLSKANDRRQVSIFTKESVPRQDNGFMQLVSSSRRPSDSNLTSATSEKIPDLVSQFPIAVTTEPTNPKPGLITELFGRSDVAQSNHKPSRHALPDFPASRSNMFDQLGRLSVGDSNNNNASTASNRF